MKRFVLVFFMLVLGTFMFAIDFGVELFADCNVGFEMGSGSTKVEASKVISIPLNLDAGGCLYIGNFGVGFSLGGGISFLGVNYAVLGYSAGYTATPFKFNYESFFEIKINETNRISLSPMCMTFNFVKNGVDLYSDEEEEIEVNRQVNFYRIMLKYTRLSEPVDKVQNGFFVGLGYTWLCETGEKDGDYLVFENNHPIMLMIGGKVLINAF